MGQIYILENKSNGKVYVGQTTQSVEKRLKCHMRSKYYIGKALRKYSIDNFKQYVYCGIPESLLDFCESAMIKRLNSISPNGYNLESGGHKNKHLSAATKRKISVAKKGKKGYWQGKHFSKEHKKKLSENHADFSGSKHPMFGRTGENSPMHGKHRSMETKRKIAAANKGKNTGKNSPVARAVLCIETQEVFNTIKEAGKKYDVCRHGICKCCRGKYKTAGGFHWRYNNEKKGDKHPFCC